MTDLDQLVSKYGMTKEEADEYFLLNELCVRLTEQVAKRIDFADQSDIRNAIAASLSMTENIALDFLNYMSNALDENIDENDVREIVLCAHGKLVDYMIDGLPAKHEHVLEHVFTQIIGISDLKDLHYAFKKLSLKNSHSPSIYVRLLIGSICSCAVHQSLDEDALLCRVVSENKLGPEDVFHYALMEGAALYSEEPVPADYYLVPARPLNCKVLKYFVDENKQMAVYPDYSNLCFIDYYNIFDRMKQQDKLEDPKCRKQLLLAWRDSKKPDSWKDAEELINQEIEEHISECSDEDASALYFIKNMIDKNGQLTHA
jgi:hypothetical protein